MLGFLSGCCAACASVFGKFAFGDIELFRSYTAFTVLDNIFDGVIVTVSISVASSKKNLSHTKLVKAGVLSLLGSENHLIIQILKKATQHFSIQE